MKNNITSVLFPVAIIFIVFIIYIMIKHVHRLNDTAEKIELIADSLDKNLPVRDSLKKIWRQNISIKDQKLVYVSDLQLYKRHKKEPLRPNAVRST